MVGSDVIADDAVQDAFANTAAAITQGKEIKSLRGWLIRCVYNTSIMYKRQRSAQPLLENCDLIDPYSHPEVAYAWRSSNEDVHRAIDKLVPGQRLAFILAEIKGLRHSEIAEIMDRSSNSVRQLLGRARKNIRDAVGPNTPPLAAPVVERGYIHVRDRVDALSDSIATRITRLQEVVASILQRATELGTQPTVALLTGAIMVTVLAAVPGNEKPAPPDQVSPVVAIQQPIVPHEQGEIVSNTSEFSIPTRVVDVSVGKIPDSSSNDSAVVDRGDTTNRMVDTLKPALEPSTSGNTSTANLEVICGEGDAEQIGDCPNNGSNNDDPEDEPCVEIPKEGKFCPSLPQDEPPVGPVETPMEQYGDRVDDCLLKTQSAFPDGGKQGSSSFPDGGCQTSKASGSDGLLQSGDCRKCPQAQDLDDPDPPEDPPDNNDPSGRLATAH